VIRGPIWLLTVFSAYLVRKLYGMRRSYQDAIQRAEVPSEKFPPFIIVTDEAHNFARRGIEFSSPARSVFREVAQEGRKYGVFLILATQRPALLDDTITAQLNTKIIFRTVRASDIKVIQEETDISGDEGGRLPYLPSGTAFISSAVVGRTVSVRIRCAWTQAPRTLNPFTELEKDYGGVDEEFIKAIADFLPLHIGQIALNLPELENALNRSVTVDEVQESLEELVVAGRLEKIEGPFGPTYK
jgi:DNA helicase HerA-like ATPase